MLRRIAADAPSRDGLTTRRKPRRIDEEVEAAANAPSPAMDAPSLNLDPALTRAATGFRAAQEPHARMDEEVEAVVSRITHPTLSPAAMSTTQAPAPPTLPPLHAPNLRRRTLSSPASLLTAQLLSSLPRRQNPHCPSFLHHPWTATAVSVPGILSYHSRNKHSTPRSRSNRNKHSTPCSRSNNSMDSTS